MIIQRISKGIKEQDWFVVLVEVLIVVVGIFIGLQVDNWNGERKNRVKEIVYLERLREDFTLNIERIGEFLDMHAGYHEHLKRVAVYLSSSNRDPEEEAYLTGRRLGIGIFPSMGVHSGTWDELVSTGRLSLLRDEELRKQLQSYFAARRFGEGQLTYFRQASTENIKFPREMEFFAVDEEGNWTRNTSFDDIRGDADVIHMLGASAAYHGGFVNMYTNELQVAHEVLAILSCTLDELDCGQLSGK